MTEEVVQSVKERFLMERDNLDVRDVTGSVLTLRERIDEHLASYFDCLSMDTNAPLVRMTTPFGGRVLEVGCGIGQVLMSLGRNGRPVMLAGVDLDVDLLRFGKVLQETREDQEANPERIAADALRLPFADCSFDLVICRVVLMSLPLVAALRELARVLAPGGRLYLHLTGAGFYLRELCGRRWKGAALGLLNGVLLSLSSQQVCARGRWNNFQNLNIVRKILEREGLAIIERKRGPRHWMFSDNLKVLAVRGSVREPDRAVVEH